MTTKSAGETTLGAELSVTVEAARLQLAKISIADGRTLRDALAELAAIASACLSVDRVTIWRLVDEDRAIQCHYLHQPLQQDVVEGAILFVSDFPKYFEACQARRVVPVMDVDSDPIALEFRDSYLRPLGISAMLDATIYQSGDIVGVVCHEHVGPAREWTAPECDFAASVADAVARLLEEHARLRAEGSLGEYRSRVAELQRIGAIGRLAAGIAHDFGNILMSINRYAAVIARAAADDPSVVAAVADLSRTVDRGSQLTKELLTLGREGSEKPSVVDLKDVLERELGVLATAAGANVALSLHVAPRVSRVLIKVSQFERVLLNLIVNARDAMPSGGSIALELREATHARAGRDETFVVVEVRDTGEGMGPATRAKIFEPFFTTKAERGTGLGLAIVKQIVTLSGGFVDVASQPGLGTSVRVFLPRIAGPATETASDL